jgi:hypothetical protein
MSKPANSGAIERHTAIGWYNYAASYQTVADHLREALGKAERGTMLRRATHVDDPVRFLYYHAIELYIKAVLRQHGKSVRKLRDVGHKFGDLRTLAEPLGFTLSADANIVFELMATSDVWSRARYLETGFVTIPTLDGLCQTCRELKQWAAGSLREAGVQVR